MVSLSIVYGVFIIKYWILARKINSILSQKEDKNTDTLAKIIIGVLATDILVFYLLEYYYYFSLIAYEKSQTIITIFMSCFCVPSVLVIYLLVDSIWKLRVTKDSKISVSLKKILAFTACIVLFVVTLLLDYI
jgi:hypothetical protein